LATKLIEEVDTLRSQTSASQVNANIPASSNLMLLPVNHLPGGSHLPAGQLTNSSAVWKDRYSERRELINAQNMQIALEKEFQAKEQLIEENSILEHELDTRQNRNNAAQCSHQQPNSAGGASCLNTLAVSNNHSVQPPDSNSMSSLSSSSNKNNAHLEQSHEAVSSQMSRKKSNVRSNSSTIYSLPSCEGENFELPTAAVKNESMATGEDTHQSVQQVKPPARF